MVDQEITDRTLSLIQDDDGEPFHLTRGDWRGLWRRFDQLHLAQQELGDQMASVRTTVHGYEQSLSKVLVSVTSTGAKVSLVKWTREAGVMVGAAALLVLAFCGLAVTGRHMGWW